MATEQCQGELPTTELGTQSHSVNRQEAENKGMLRRGRGWGSNTEAPR